MSFLSPAFLLGLLALGVPLALHLIRRRVVRTVPFPALRFLAATRADERKHRLRRRLVLALRCLALALLAAAFARPFFGAPPSAAGRATVVVVDNSFSLQASDRWPALLRWTRQQLDAPRSGDSLGLLLMNPTPRWLVPPTQDTAAALAALDRLRPGWESSRVEPALRLAGDVLASTPARERHLVFLGDHQARGWAGTDFAKPLPPGLKLSFPPPSAAPRHQAALLSASLHREAESWSLSVSARRFAGDSPRTLSVFVADSSAPLLASPLAFDSAGDASLRLPLPKLPQDFAWLRLVLDPDELPADDTLWLASPSHSRSTRLVILDRPPSATEADYLAAAFQSLADLPPSLQPAPLPQDAWPATAVAVLRNNGSFAGEDSDRLDAFIAAGGSALVFLDNAPAQRAWLARHAIAPAPLKLDPSPSTAREPQAARLRDWDLDHPLVQPLAAQNLRAIVGWEFSRGWTLPADRVEPLAFWQNGDIALGELRIGAGRILLAGWSPSRADGDWPLNPAFLPFLHQAASHLANLAATPSAPARVGSSIHTGAAGAWRLLSAPAGAPPPPSAPTETLTPEAPGLYEFTADGAPARLFAVGLSPDESDLSPWPDGTPWLGLASPERLPAPELETRASLAPAPVSEDRNPLWWWALAAVALFALSELSLANRTAR